MHDESWVSVAGQMCAPPAQVFLTLPPGEQHTEALSTALTIDTGNYRFLFDLRSSIGHTLPVATRTSDTFKIE
jgi:hypothetical protein